MSRAGVTSDGFCMSPLSAPLLAPSTLAASDFPSDSPPRTRRPGVERGARVNQERPQNRALSPEGSLLVHACVCSPNPYRRTSGAPSTRDWTTVLGGVKGALAPLGGCAALDPACAPCGSAFVDGGMDSQDP